MATDLLAPATETTEQKLDRIADRLDALTERMAADRAALERWRELGAELTTLTGPAMALLTDRLAEAENRGYVTFARGTARIADRVVTSFDADDLDALGDNVVLILRTVQEMTQPEVMGLLRRTAVGLHDDLVDDVERHPAPPSTWTLLHRLRDPQVRRGLDRALGVLGSLGARAQTPQTPTPATNDESPKD